MIGDDLVSLIVGAVAFDGKYAGTRTATAVLRLSGTDSGTYTVNPTASDTAEITRLAIGGAVTADDKVYDGTTGVTVTGRTLTGAIAGDAVCLTGGTASFGDQNAGADKVVTLTGAALSGADAGNSTLTSVATTVADITPRAVTVAAEAKTKVYGSADPVLTYHVTDGSLVAGDGFAGALTRAPGEDVATYAIQKWTLALSSNYALTYVGADLTIGKVGTAVTVTLSQSDPFGYTGQVQDVASAKATGVGLGAVPLAVTYYRLSAGTPVATVSALQAAITAGTAVVADPKEAGAYVAFASYAGDANHAGASGLVTFAIARRVLDVDATTQGTINIGENGSINFTLAVIGGIVDGRSVSALFNGATFTIEVRKGDGSVVYGTLTSVAKVNADGTITVSLENGRRAEGGVVPGLHEHGCSVDFRLSATSTGGNYVISEDAFARLLNNGKFRYVP